MGATQADVLAALLASARSPNDASLKVALTRLVSEAQHGLQIALREGLLRCVLGRPRANQGDSARRT